MLWQRTVIENGLIFVVIDNSCQPGYTHFFIIVLCQSKQQTLVCLIWYSKMRAASRLRLLLRSKFRGPIFTYSIAIFNEKIATHNRYFFTLTPTRNFNILLLSNGRTGHFKTIFMDSTLLANAQFLSYHVSYFSVGIAHTQRPNRERAITGMDINNSVSTAYRRDVLSHMSPRPQSVRNTRPQSVSLGLVRPSLAIIHGYYK